MLRVSNRPAFTLVESVLVLSLLALVLTLTFSFRPRKEGISVQQFEAVFASAFSAAKTRAQTKQEEQVISFEKAGMRDQNELLPYPGAYEIIETKEIRIASSGFVSPQSIRWKSGDKVLKLIIQFGGGSYRFTS